MTFKHFMFKIFNGKFIYFLVFLFIILLILYNNQLSKTVFNSEFSNGAKIARNNFLACSNEASRTFLNEPTKFFKEFKFCIQTYIKINETQMDNFVNDMMGEKKMFLPLISKNNYHSPIKCKWLTIGIGGVNTAERLLKEKYPECEVFGAELLPKFYGNFSSIGKLIPHGVGIEDTEVLIDVNENGKNIQKPTKILSLTHLMDEYVGTRLIHYLTIDIEGYEYLILEQLVNNGKFAQDGINFCQIDAELHFTKFPGVHPKAKNLNAVEFINNFIGGSSPYIPIYNAPYTYHPHQKVTFINIENSECEKAFNFSKYFSK